MITLKEFWNSKEQLAIHCKEEWQAKKLLCAFHRMGKKWGDGDSYVERMFMQLNGEKTCYTNCCSHTNTNDLSFKIIEFEEIDDFDFKVGDRVRIRQWDDMANEYECNCYKLKCKGSFVDGMEYLCGREFIIREIIDNNYVDDIDGWQISTDMIEKVYDEEKKKDIKQYCIVINAGKSYVNYPNVLDYPQFEKYKDNYKCIMSPNYNKIYLVLEKYDWKENFDIVYLIQNEDTKQVYVIGEEGIKLLDKNKLYIHLGRCNGKTKILKEFTEKMEEEKDMLLLDTEYSFRFNEERKSVTLYENGKKVQFVKPQKEDRFNWKIGLGVAFYKQLYKGNADVEYVKGIVNEKTLYNYCVARFFEFDKYKVATLEEHVKNCKRPYCEFQLTKILKGE